MKRTTLIWLVIGWGFLCAGLISLMKVFPEEPIRSWLEIIDILIIVMGAWLTALGIAELD